MRTFILLLVACLTGCVSSPPESYSSYEAALKRYPDLLRIVVRHEHEFPNDDNLDRKGPLQPGSVVWVEVVGESEMSRLYVVETEGYFFFPLLGKVDVVGISISELRENICRRLHCSY